jgi:hypothetical protein
VPDVGAYVLGWGAADEYAAAAAEAPYERGGAIPSSVNCKPDWS